jgi:hypothetical protein
MTPQQLATLKTAIIADATAGPMRNAGDTVGLLAWCNGVSAVLAWLPSVQPQVADEAATYTAFDGIVAGKRDSWRIFLMFPRDFSKNKIRNWITDVWGNSTAGSIAEAILQAGTQLATNAQAALGGTTRTTGSVAALSLNFTGLVSQADVNVLVN